MTRRRALSPPRPFTEAEDADLIEMAEIGLSIEAWAATFRGRTLGELLARRLELREAGRLKIAEAI
jgi:hypothetical protein